MKFTTFIANEIKNNNWLNEHLVIVVPSERATKYLLAALSKSYNKPVFAPKMVTINDLVIHHASSPVMDSTRMLISLYQAYRNLALKDEQSFEDFLSWGSMLLNDFDEIDRYLLEPAQVFKNLKSIKELESWNLEEKELTEAQKKFMVFWDILSELYTELQLILTKKGKIGPGMAYKKLAKEATILFKEDPNSFYLFAGFNALSTAELKLIDTVLTLKKGAFYMDSDQYYFNNKQHEAGDFQRKNSAVLSIGKPQRLEDNLSTKAVNISIIQCAQLTGQVKVASTELEKLSKNELDETLLMLADEALISALIKNLPASINQANITLGLPLNQTPIKSWVELIFDIQENKKRFKTKAIYFKDLQKVANHVLFNAWLSNTSRKQMVVIEQEAIRYNKVFQNLQNLSLEEDTHGFLTLVLEDWENDWVKAIRCIRELNASILEKLPLANDFERNVTFVFDQALRDFQLIASEDLPVLSLRTFKMLFNQHRQTKSIAFHGNPIDGLQIMGLLETRLLDFKRIIILGMNEGNLPPTNAMNTVIPMDLRKGLGLPTMRHKQGLFAQHFYRLLHYCEDLTLTYTTIGDQINAAEPSRYLNQLELELIRLNPNAKLNKSYYLTAFSTDEDLASNIVLKKSQIKNQLDAYFSKPISASAINKYLTCPLDFYYRYIVEFGEEQNVAEEVESSDLGILIHSVLEKLFKPFAQRDKHAEFVYPPPKALDTDDVNTMIDLFPDILFAVFMERFHNDATLFATGKNLLSFEMASEIVLKTLQAEKEYIGKLEEPFYIEQVEAELTINIPVIIGGEEKEIMFKGYIDRIDRVGDKYRILDYKTGKVDSSFVTFQLKETGIKASFIAAKHSLQLTLYGLFFKEKYKLVANEAVVFSLITTKEKTQVLTNKDGTIAELEENFFQLIQEIATELYDFEIPFTHNETSKYCSYC